MLDSQKKIILFLGLDIAILLLFILLVSPHLIDRIKGAAQEYLSNQEILVNLDWRESLVKELEESYQSQAADLAQLEGAFLNHQEAVGFISTLESIAQQTGNIFEIKTASSFIPANKKGEAEESFLAFRISLWGNFNNLINFLANLEDNPYPPYRLIEIDSISIRRLEATGLNKHPGLSQGDLETILGIKIYTQ